MTHDEHMLTPDQVRDRVASAATRTVEPGRVSVLERLQQERDTSARLADQVNELGEEVATLRAENAALREADKRLRDRLLHAPTPPSIATVRHEDLAEAHQNLAILVHDLIRRHNMLEEDVTRLYHDPQINATRTPGEAA